MCSCYLLSICVILNIVWLSIDFITIGLHTAKEVTDSKVSWFMRCILGFQQYWSCLLSFGLYTGKRSSSWEIQKGNRKQISFFLLLNRNRSLGRKGSLEAVWSRRLSSNVFFTLVCCPLLFVQENSNIDNGYFLFKKII